MTFTATLANELPVMAGGPGVSSGAATSHGSSELCFSFLLLAFGLGGGFGNGVFSLRLCLVEVGSEKVYPNITRKPKSKIMTPKAHNSSRKDIRRPLCAIRTVSVSRARCFLCQRTCAWSYIYGEERRREERDDGKTGRRRRVIYRKEPLGGQMSQLGSWLPGSSGLVLAQVASGSATVFFA
jgi:hypothetical protein